MKLSLMKITLAFLSAAVLAGIVHFASVLLMPSVASHHGTARLLRHAPSNTFTPLETMPTLAETATFNDAATLGLVCRYALQQGPVRVDVATGEGFLSIVFLQANGQVLTSMTDKVAQRRVISVIVARPDQIAALEAEDPDDDVPAELRLSSASDEGIVLVRAVVARATDAPVVRDLLSRARCSRLAS